MTISAEVTALEKKKEFQKIMFFDFLKFNFRERISYLRFNILLKWLFSRGLFLPFLPALKTWNIFIASKKK